MVLNSKAAIEEFQNTTNVYSDKSWTTYKASVEKLEAALSSSANESELSADLHKVYGARKKLVVDDESSIELPYKQIMRYPDEVKGKLVRYSGTVVEEYDSSLGYRAFVIKLDGAHDRYVLTANDHLESYDPKGLYPVGSRCEVIGFSEGVYEVNGNSTAHSLPFVNAQNMINLSKIDSLDGRGR